MFSFLVSTTSFLPIQGGSFSQIFFFYQINTSQVRVEQSYSSYTISSFLVALSKCLAWSVSECCCQTAHKVKQTVSYHPLFMSFSLAPCRVQDCMVRLLRLIFFTITFQLTHWGQIHYINHIFHVPT